MNYHSRILCCCDEGVTFKSEVKTSSIYCMSCFLQWMLFATIILSTNGAMAAEKDKIRLQKDMQVLGERHSQSSPLKWSVSGVTAMGGSTLNSDELKQLQAGSHDPKQNGFTIQALALAVHAKLDNHVDATASIVSHIEPDGESVVELEQAFIHAKDLYLDTSVMAGQYFLNFGEENTLHPDDWDFVDVPFLLTRLFGGDKLRSQGIDLSWQLPSLSSSTLLFGVSNPHGETATSFFYKQGEDVAGHKLKDREVSGMKDLLYLLKWSNKYSTNNSPHRIGFGASALFGPNATGDSTNTQIYGLNFDWSLFSNGQSQKPKLNWRTELMYRNYEAGDTNDTSNEILKDYGLFSQAVWQLDNYLALGLRAEFANGNSGNFNTPQRTKRKRFSINVTRSLSKSIKWRLQYNRDLDDSVQDKSADSVWLQMIFKAGDHDEHE